MVEWELKDLIRPGVKRTLDFIILDELRKRTGISPDSILKFALAELLCNALDKPDASEISIDVQVEGDFCRLEVRDNGSKKLSLEEIRLILDFENKASSKRGFLRVSRGYLGNALKCLCGYSYSLSENRGLVPQDIIVKSGGFEYRISLKPDRVKAVINSEVTTVEVNDGGFTSFTFKFPKEHASSPQVLKDIVFATSMVNPSRKISYNIFGETGILGSSHEKTKSIRHETSALWYTQKQFESLFEDFVRAKPETQLKQFIALFRGFTSKKIIWENLQALNAAVNHDRNNANLQFFPTTQIKDVPRLMVSKLFAVMKSKSKSIAKRSIPSVLGFVGEQTFQKLREQHGWKRLRYTMIPATMMECPERYRHVYIDGPCRNPDHVEFPYLIELAVFDRGDDGEGLKVYQCVNFMASMEDVFSRIFNINYRLGIVGIKPETPVTVVAHLVCPVLKWLNYGKSGLDE
ncbi:MAG: ATP-binding protein [Candidatus Bathyarchaeia archaeon]|nr:ATP-binding protein [Candidatus Bathyarchaeia archaeon]